MNENIQWSGNNLTMQIITMQPADNKTEITGSGIAQIRLNATMTTKTYSFSAGQDVSFGNHHPPVTSPGNFSLSILSIEVGVE